MNPLAETNTDRAGSRVEPTDLRDQRVSLPVAVDDDRDEDAGSFSSDGTHPSASPVRSKVAFELDGEIGRIRLDDGKANTIERVFMTELEEALDRAEQERARMLVIEGRPGVFSSGLDLKALPALAPSARRNFLRGFGRLMLRLFQFPRPVIAAVTGSAVGAGAVLMLACDARYAVEGSYKIGLGAVPAGLAMPSFAIEMARCALPHHAHTRCIVFGEMLDPQQALALRLVDELCAPGDLLRRALLHANILARLPDPAFGFTKRVLRSPAVSAALAREEFDIDEFFRAGPFAAGGAHHHSPIGGDEGDEDAKDDERDGAGATEASGRK